MNATAKALWLHRGKLFLVSFFAMFATLLTSCNEAEHAEIHNNTQRATVANTIAREIVSVSNESQLRAAVTQAGDTPTTVTLTSDIVLQSNFVIPANADIVLTSAGNTMFSLITNRSMDVITVSANAILTMENIVVTNRGIEGMQFVSGVRVQPRGTFVMNDGHITGNITEYGGGVHNLGNFTMNGGVIYHNTGRTDGGGVYNRGTFIMNGGIIFGNSSNGGGGVTNHRTFTMNGGEIRENNSFFSAGGVDNGGRFGDGRGTFIMHGGTISNNNSTKPTGVFGFIEPDLAGVLVRHGTTFTIDGGWIFNNLQTDVFVRGGTFNNDIFDPNNGAVGSSPNGSLGNDALEEIEPIEFVFDIWRRSILGGDLSRAASDTIYYVFNLTGGVLEFPYGLRTLIHIFTGINVGDVKDVGSAAHVGKILGEIAQTIGMVRYTLDFAFLDISIIQMLHYMEEQRFYYQHFSPVPTIVANIDKLINEIESFYFDSIYARIFYIADLVAAGLVKYKFGPLGSLAIWTTLQLDRLLGGDGELVSTGLIRELFDDYDDISDRIRNREYLIN